MVTTFKNTSVISHYLVGYLLAPATCIYFFIYLFVHLIGHSHLQRRMAEAGVLVCLMLAATLFFRLKVNFEMDGRRRHLKLVSSTYMLRLSS